MEKIKLTAREECALRDIAQHPGNYSIFWTPKTNIELEKKGLVEIIRRSVKITDSGIEWLKS